MPVMIMLGLDTLASFFPMLSFGVHVLPFSLMSAIIYGYLCFVIYSLYDTFKKENEFAQNGQNLQTAYGAV